MDQFDRAQELDLTSRDAAIAAQRKKMQHSLIAIALIVVMLSHQNGKPLAECAVVLGVKSI